ncbi:mismatch-specific DNA-glycosylase [Aspergillus melleus]|uniref:mismatch-specific DNA-glycosylase n=1 Tax=Aspergillus melleus TaxID=138277 RepID=UPI001E8DCDD4|nr:uracil DNA N-glycosylase Thp1 [Aspergillus melleus]KAH8435287.1 uracil DNA N-glycosylase Thp1 [Aspergillus melleus]
MPPSEYTCTIQDVSKQDIIENEDNDDNDVPVNKLTSFNGRLNQYFHASKNVNGGREQKMKLESSGAGGILQDDNSSGSSSESKRGLRPLDEAQDLKPDLSNSTEPIISSPKRRRTRQSNPFLSARMTRSKSTITASASSTSSSPQSTSQSPNPPSKTKPPTRSRRPRTSRTTTPSASPSPTSSLLRDTIPPNLTLLLVGVNPGIMTGTTGYAYAHPSNLFWKLLHSSGITTIRHPPSDTYRLPDLYNVGNTNIVERPTRDASMLSKAEMDAGVPVLEAKVAAQRPEAVCLVGKSIWEAVWRVRRGRGIRKEEFRYGWQGEGEKMGRCEGWDGAPVFVATTTSGLAAGMTMAQKEAVWNELGMWVVRRREEMKEEQEQKDMI